MFSITRRIHIFLSVLIGLTNLPNTNAETQKFESFHDEWLFYNANDSAFFTVFGNRAFYFTSQCPWKSLDLWENLQLPHTYNKGAYNLGFML